MTDEEIINDYIPMVQKRCMGIVREIDSICRNNGIKYSLCGGSVIGAYLFHGFIPWDDDIDLMMSRDNYERFIDIFPRDAKGKYHLLNYRTEEKANVPTLFSRVEDLETEVTEEIAGHIRNGHVFVDITVMDNITSKFYHKLAVIYGGYVYTKLYRCNGMTPGTGWKKLLFNVTMRKVDDDRALIMYSKFEDFCKKKSYLKSNYCAELLSAAYSGYLYEKEFFDDYIDIDFEDAKLMVIKKYIDYLHIRYGNREFTKEVSASQRFKSHIISFKLNNVKMRS